MRSILHLVPLIVFCFLLPTPTWSQDNPTINDKLINILNLMYTVEDFQERFGYSLENNPGFQEYVDEDLFLKEMSTIARATALSSYATAIKTKLYENLSEPQLDSLLTLMNSGYGDLFRKVLEIDHQLVTPALDEYVAEIVGKAERKLYERDSFWYATEYPIDLRPIMPGTYQNPLPSGKRAAIERKDDLQIESVDGASIIYGVTWINNSKYLLVQRQNNVFLGEEDSIYVNVYAVEDKVFKYIVQFPDGSFDRGELIKESFDDYGDEINTFRAELNSDYFNPYTSPIPADELPAFREAGGHAFYPVDQQYRLTARLEALPEPQTVTFNTSSSQEVEYALFGYVTVILDGKEYKLSVYQYPGVEDKLFLPFTDETSGETTYAGGRYFYGTYDVKAGTMNVDFNFAYQPYCVYSTEYSCPIPPPGNHLDVKIEAGVKLSDH